MGHFSHNCKLTGLPITGGNAVLIVMKPQENLWGNSEEKQRKYGSTYMCSNDGPRLKYIPCWYPIKGEYDTYGRLENIVHDDNTAILEEYYGLTIEQIIDIVCSGRKDDGYDDALDVIKKKPEYPEDWIEGEKHFDRYQEWTKTNPDYDDDYGNPQYQERYLELLSLSGMWVHGDLYEQLTKEKIEGQWRDSLDMGTPQLLNALGFVELPQKGKGRYNRKFEKDGLILNSDGTWLEVPNEHIYRLKDLKKYCEKKGVHIDIEEIDNKDFYEQVLDYVMPTFKIPKPIELLDQDEELKDLLENLPNQDENGEKKLSEEDELKIKKLIETKLDEIIGDDSHLGIRVYNIFLNTNRYGSARITNPLTPIYMERAKEGKLRDNIVQFWRFDQYMYACGKYYEIVGTGPQDGEHKMVLKVLETASNILKEEIKEYYGDEDEWIDDED